MKFSLACLIGAAVAVSQDDTAFDADFDYEDPCASLEPYSEAQVQCYEAELCGEEGCGPDPCADLPEEEQGSCYEDLLSDLRPNDEDPCEELSGEEEDACYADLWEDPCDGLDTDEAAECYSELLSDLEPCDSSDSECW